MKEDIAELAVKIHVHFMEREEYDCPDFDKLFAKASEYHEIEKPIDLHMIAFAIEQLSNWDLWTAEWLCEDQEAKSQQRDEDLLRGDI